jgi:hypothetical protein
VYRGTSPAGEDLTSPTAVDGGTTTYTDAGAVPGVAYYYEVTATNSFGEGAASSEAGATALPPVPTSPTILSAIGSNQQVALTWTAPNYAAAYDIYRATATGQEGSTPYAANLSTPSYTDTAVANGTAYFYTVVARNASGVSAPSNEAMATPYAAPAGLAGIGGYKLNLLTWSPVAGANGGGYIVSRSTTSGGPYTQLNGAPINGTAYLDSDHLMGLGLATTYYYVVKYLDANYRVSPQSTEAAVTTAPRPSGMWQIVISPMPGQSPGSTPASPTAYAVGTTDLTSVSAAAGVIGAQSASNTQTAQSTCSGTWTATFNGNTGSAWPQLYVLDEIASQSASVAVTGAYSGSVSTANGTLLAAADPSTETALDGLPGIVTSIDATTDPGHIVFIYDRATDTRTLTQSGTTTTGYTESLNDTKHIVHVYTPAYFAAHFTDPTQIVLTFAPSACLTATATLPAGAPASASCVVSGSVSDAFSNYAVKH